MSTDLCASCPFGEREYYDPRQLELFPALFQRWRTGTYSLISEPRNVTRCFGLREEPVHFVIWEGENLVEAWMGTIRPPRWDLPGLKEVF